MAGPAIEQMYRYATPSALRADGALCLATSSSGGDEHPHFFTGTLRCPERTAQLLLALMQVVHARYHIPAALLGRILLQADPVVTSSDDRLRFEGFSACCGAYARVDLHPEALEGQRFGRGTTNVDFNQPMLTALSKIRGSAKVSLAVGTNEVALQTQQGAVVEKKVQLPVRWLKGFVEVQACQSRMKPSLSVSGPEATRFLRTLPRMKTNRRATWIVRSGNGLRLSQVEPRGGGVRVGGLERLKSLERLASQAKQLRIFSDESTGASGWVLKFEDSQFHLILSPEVWRGFSGEGQVLTALAGSDWKDCIHRVRAQLGWHSILEPEAIATQANVSKDAVESALSALGTQGQVGFDVDASAYFQRILPFDLSQLETLQPRLKAARKLVAENKVRLVPGSASLEEVEAYVTSADVEHRVLLVEHDSRCSCTWYAKHKNSRGPCKHILAVQITREAESFLET